MKISFFDKMAYSTENIRYLLWQARPHQRDAWPKQLAAWLSNDDLEYVTALIAGYALATTRDQQLLLTTFDDRYQEQHFQYARLVELDQVAILLENIRFLTEIPNEMKQKEFATAIGVTPVTLSRWRSGEQKPHKSNQIAIVSYFGLPHEIDLEVDALFLYPGPISDAQRRSWLRGAIDRLDVTTLRRLFPAFERLLKDP